MTSPTVLLPFQQHLASLAGRWLQPQKLANMACRAPQRLNCLIVETTLNKAFAEQLNEGDFDFLQQRQLGVEITDACLFVNLSCRRGKLICTHFGNAPVPADARLSVNSSDAIALILQEVDPDTLFFQRRLKIAGDTELAHQVKNTIDTLEADALPKFVPVMLEHYRLRVFQL